MAERLGTTERERQIREQERHTANARRMLAIVPIALVVIFTTLWAIPSTRELATGRNEANPVELLTFIFMLVAAGLAWRLALRLYRLGHGSFVVAMFTLFGLVALIVALDEIAWGQVFVNMASEGLDARGNEPAAINLTGLRDRTEIFRLTFAVAGIAGVFFDRVRALRMFAVPKQLLPWLIVIGVVSAIDVVGDFVTFSEGLRDFFFRTSELIEMMIAMVAVLYINFKSRDLWWRIP
jgi:hypothetical protein